MHDEPINDPLNDLVAALDVTPSPEFAAKVRARVEEQAPAVRWGWRLLVAGSVVAAVVAAVVALRPVPRTVRPEQKSARDEPAIGAPAPLSQPGQPLPVVTQRTRKVSAAPARTPRRPGDTGIRQAYGNVLVPSDQAIALRSLLLGIRAGRVSVPRETRAPVDTDGLLLAPEPIRIPLIQIEPILADPEDGSGEK